VRGTKHDTHDAHSVIHSILNVGTKLATRVMRYVMRAAMVAVVLLMVGPRVTAQTVPVTVTECGKSDGHAYYFSGGLVPTDKSGWRKDGIDGGRIILNLINGEIDLLIKDTTGTTRSVKQDGGKIIPRNTNNDLIAVTVFYEGGSATTEDYVFQIDDRGNGTVVSTLIRTAGRVNKMSLTAARCSGPK
jgi:hypothetical protein